MTQMEIKRAKSFYPQFNQHLSLKCTLQTGLNERKNPPGGSNKNVFHGSEAHIYTFKKLQFFHHQSGHNKIMTATPPQSHTDHICINPIISLKATFPRKQKQNFNTVSLSAFKKANLVGQQNELITISFCLYIY